MTFNESWLAVGAGKPCLRGGGGCKAHVATAKVLGFERFSSVPSSSPFQSEVNALLILRFKRVSLVVCPAWLPHGTWLHRVAWQFARSLHSFSVAVLALQHCFRLCVHACWDHEQNCLCVSSLWMSCQIFKKLHYAHSWRECPNCFLRWVICRAVCPDCFCVSPHCCTLFALMIEFACKRVVRWLAVC